MKTFKSILTESVLAPSLDTSSALNEQYNKELASAYLYDIMAHYFEQRNLLGFAKLFEEQADEEREHAESFRKFLLDTGVRVNFMPIQAIDQNFNSVMECARLALSHEQEITASISAICEMAKMNEDKAAKIFLQDFVTEQIDEEKAARNLIKKLELIGNDGTGILALDLELQGK